MADLMFSERTLFSTVCKVLEQIAALKDKKQKSEVMSKFIIAFYEQSKNYKDDSFYPIMRLLLPQSDRERGAYGIKEHTLAKTYTRILCLPSQSRDAQKLLNYRSTTVEATDFAVVAYWVLRSRFSTNGDLTVRQVNEYLDNIATKHANNDPRGVDAELQSMILKMSAMEQKWLIRIILKDMKLGLSSNKILSLFHPDAIDYLEVTSDLKTICTVLKDRSVRFHEIDIILFKAFKPMLCQRCDVQNVNTDIKKADSYYVELKFDGERFQMHMKNGEFKYLSRNGYDYTNTYGCNSSFGVLTPKLSKLLKPSVQSCILDGEMMCWNTKQKCITTKGKNIDVKSLNVYNVHQPCFVVFDILLLNDQILTNKPLLERFKILEEIIKQEEGILMISAKDIVENQTEIMNLLNQAILNSEEGIVVKDCTSVYKPNARNSGWYKIKPEYTAGLMVELDLIILAGYDGGGRRHGLISQFLLGVADTQKDEDNHPVQFYPISRVGSGYSDDELKELNGKLLFQRSGIPPNIIGLRRTKEKPNVWILPSKSCILQVKATEVMPCDSFNVGYTLRFPRIEKIRYDKPWYDCLTLEEFNKLTKLNCGKLTACYASKLNEPKQRKVTKRTKEILAVKEDCQLKKVKNLEIESAIFQDKEICVLPFTGSTIGKSELELKILQNGGSIAQNPGSTTFCIVADDSNNLRLANVIKLNKYNVLKPSWILQCINNQLLQKWKPSDFIAIIPSTAEELSLQYDKYGDSYTEPVTDDQLRQLLDSMTPKTLVTYEEILELDKELFGKSNPFAIFRGCYAYFDETFENNYVLYIASTVKVVFRFNGGVEESSISDKTTYVISFSKHHPGNSISKNLPVIHYIWVMDSWKVRTLLNISKYELSK